MTKIEFFAAFRQACSALSAELLDGALADYERNFTDQILAGQSETAIVGRWGTPQQAALKLKLGTLGGNLKQPVSAEKVARVGINGLGLALLDFLLLGPVALGLTVLASLYLGAGLIYLSGIFVSAANLAGVDTIDVPAQFLAREFDVRGSTHLEMGNLEIVPQQIMISARDGSGAVPVPGFHLVARPQTLPVWRGLGMTLAGMLMLTLCFWSTGAGLRRFKQFAVWHVSVLKNA